MIHDNANESRMLAVVTIAIAVLLLATAMVSADGIRLYDQAATKAAQVRLADIAELQGPVAEGLADLVVAKFEGSHKKVTVELNSLRQLLTNEAKVNWARLSLSGYLQCEVIRLVPPPVKAVVESKQAAPIVSNHIEPIDTGAAYTLRDRVIAYLETLTGQARGDLEIVFKERDEEALGQVAYHGRWEIDPGTSANLGRINMTIFHYDTSNAVVATYRISADVARRLKAVSVIRTVSRGQMLTPGDVELREVKWGRDKQLPTQSLEQVVGQMAARKLQNGEVVTTADLRPATQVHRGDDITIRVFRGSLVVRTVGRALGSGGKGEVIEVRPYKSRDSLRVRITGRGEGVLVSDQVVMTGGPR